MIKSFTCKPGRKVQLNKVHSKGLQWVFGVTILYPLPEKRAGDSCSQDGSCFKQIK